MVHSPLANEVSPADFAAAKGPGNVSKTMGTSCAVGLATPVIAPHIKPQLKRESDTFTDVFPFPSVLSIQEAGHECLKGRRATMKQKPQAPREG